MKPIQQISAQEAYEHIKDGAFLLDVRESDEVSEISCDVENTLHIPMSLFQSKVQTIPKDKEIITICRSGGRSFVATQLLHVHGFENVFNLSGGIMAWENSGLPIK
jgi:rhodanese-related sulfurtransferase